MLAQTSILEGSWRLRQANVRFGSKADMCSVLGDVRFVPKADIDALILPIVGTSILR